MILIAESGSSKTDWRFISETKEISQAKTVGINPYFQSFEDIFQEINKSIKPLIQESVSHVFYYGTGITNEEKANVIKDVFKQIFPECSEIEVNSDVIAAARAVCGHEAGIACILGTGSNSCLFDGEKISFQVPPLGFWLGDEGSGAFLGKSLVLAYLHKELPEDVRALFEMRFGAKNRIEIIENAYQKPNPNRYFAGFSKFLFDNRNHPFVNQMICRSFSLFFEKYLLKYPDVHRMKIHFVGSVAFYYSDILRKVASDAGLTVGIIMESPIAGLTLYHSV